MRKPNFGDIISVSNVFLKCRSETQERNAGAKCRSEIERGRAHKQR